MKKSLTNVSNSIKGVLLTFILMFAMQTVFAQDILCKDLIVGQRADAKTLDPPKSIDSISNRVIGAMFETLVFVNEDLELVPQLAEKWEVVDDLTTVFYLKKGVKFHNGETMTSEDVIYSLNRARKSPQTGYYYTLIEDIVPVDEYTVKIITSKPFGAMLSYLSNSGSAVVSKKAVEELGDSFAQNPVGTGPYKFKKWVPGDEIVMEKYNEYHGDVAKNDSLTIKIIPEVTNRTIALETGEIDIAFDIGTLDREFLKSHDKLRLVEVEAPSILYLGFDSSNPLFDNKKLRQAIAYAIDKDALVEATYMGGATAADSALPPIVPGYNPNVKKYSQNLELAKQLLTEAGYPNGIEIDFWITNQSTWTDVATIIQDQVKQIGIDLNIQTYEWGAYVSRTAYENKPLYLLSWNVRSVDGDSALYPLFHSEEKGSSGNRSFYNNKTVDNLLLEARTTIDQEKRKEIYGEVQEIIQEELPHYTLVYPKYNLGARKRLENLNLQRNGYVDFSQVYVKK